MAFYSKFAHYYDSIFPFKQPMFEFLHSYTTPEMKNVLDVGCGTGHYTAAFSRAGFQSTGIDVDEAMIQCAHKQYSAPDFYVMNMLDIASLKQQFDLIFCIGNTLAHLTKLELHHFLHAVSHALAPDGVWIFQVRNWDYVLQRDFYDFPLLTANDNRLRFSRTYNDISKDSLQFNTRLTEDDNLIFEDSVNMTPLTSKHYLDMHHNHHFQLVHQFGDFKRTPFDPNTDSAHILIFKKQ